MSDANEQTPDTKGLAQTRMEAPIRLFRDVLGGTSRMREASEAYLPKFEREETDDYKKRLAQAVFYNATKLTRDALVGMVLRTDPEVDDKVPDQLDSIIENVDLTGKHLAVFTKDLFSDAWDGLACILVDKQAPAVAPASAQEERDAGLRPYWVRITAANVLRATAVNVNGKDMLGRFAYLECVTLADGEFGEREERRVRDYQLVLRPDGTRTVLYTVWACRTEGDREAWVVLSSGTLARKTPRGSASWDEIPVAVCYTGQTGFFSAEPPLLDLAHENIDHYQQRSEHRVAWKYARVPVPVFPGMSLDQVVLSVNRGICTPTPEAKPYYLETEGKSLSGSKEELREGERRMAMLGASMLYNADRAVTATEKRIETAQSQSRLAFAARDLNDCLEEAVRFTAKWEDIELPEKSDGRWVTVSRDFERFEMDAQMITALDNAVGNGNLTLETFLTALRDGVPPLAMLDPEAEAAKLAAAPKPEPEVDPAQDQEGGAAEDKAA